jgi:hypothetical protein
MLVSCLTQALWPCWSTHHNDCYLNSKQIAPHSLRHGRWQRVGFHHAERCDRPIQRVQVLICGREGQEAECRELIERRASRSNLILLRQLPAQGCCSNGPQATLLASCVLCSSISAAVCPPTWRRQGGKEGAVCAIQHVWAEPRVHTRQEEAASCPVGDEQHDLGAGGRCEAAGFKWR